MAVATMVTGSQGAGSKAYAVVASALLSSLLVISLPPAKSKSISGDHIARIDESLSPSVGLAAARMIDIEPEKEFWRGIARDWFVQVLAGTPGTRAVNLVSLRE